MAKKYELFGDSAKVTAALRLFKHNLLVVHRGLTAANAAIQDKPSEEAEVSKLVQDANNITAALRTMTPSTFVPSAARCMHCNNTW